MKKIKIIICVAVLILGFIPLISIYAQNSRNFLQSDLVINIVETSKEFVNTELFELIVANKEKVDSNQIFFNAPAIFKMQTEVKIKDENLLNNYKYFTALYIDIDGIFDLTEVFEDDNRPGYTPELIENDEKYRTFIGTREGKHYIIGIISTKKPYFGNMYNNIGSSNPIAQIRYVENLQKELSRIEAVTSILEFDIVANEL